MTRPDDRNGGALCPEALARYAAALAAAADPNRVMDDAADLFRDMAVLARAGDRQAVSGAAIATGDACLRLCATLADSALAAENKVRFLRIVVGWAWVREPALGAVMEASIQADRRAWGDDLGA